MMLTFRVRYFIIAVLLFITEVLIALYVHDAFVRPYVGDFLVVMLLYCFVRSFVNASVLPVAIGVLLFAFAIETGQYFHLIFLLGWEQSALARAVIGTSFAWNDLLMYVLGTAFIIIVEKYRSSKA